MTWERGGRELLAGLVLAGVLVALLFFVGIAAYDSGVHAERQRAIDAGAAETRRRVHHNGETAPGFRYKTQTTPTEKE
jgi:hypothetical protein